MYIRGLIPRNFAELAEAVPIDTEDEGSYSTSQDFSDGGANWTDSPKVLIKNIQRKIVNNFLPISLKYVWVLKRTVSLRRFF